MRIHKALEGLRGGGPIVDGDTGSHLSEQERLAFVDKVVSSHKFEILNTEYLDQQIVDTAAALFNGAILRLPYETCLFEVASEKWRRVAASDYMAVLATQMEHGEIEFSLVTSPSTDNAMMTVKERELLGSDMSFLKGKFAAVVNAFSIVPVASDDASAYCAWIGDEMEKIQSFSSIRFTDFCITELMGIICFMSTKMSEVRDVPTPHRLNAARERRGERPLFGYSTVRISSAVKDRLRLGTFGPHASPRLHWRRGHVRTLPSGNRVGVLPHLVGIAENGYIRKNYAVSA